MGRRWLVVLVAMACFAGVAAMSSCSVQNANIGIDAPDGSEQAFGPVGDYLEQRCGTLDCHGQSSRNLQIWGCEGMRLDPNDVPFCSQLQGGKPTTPAEHYVTYRSLVGLEPAVMSAVVAGGGMHPELLTFIRKARGFEAHKGGQLVDPGDDQDVCMTSWLAGNTNTTACVIALNYPLFPGVDAAP
jgi:hypothetical protein